MKITLNELNQVKEIESLLKKVDEIYNGLSDELQDDIRKMHNEGYSLDHCIRWGLQASEEIVDEASKTTEKKLPMTVKDFMQTREDPYDELTCYDKDIDSEFYMYLKEPVEEESMSQLDKDLAITDKFEECLMEHVMVTDIIDEDTVEVGLYEFLENPEIVEYAKENMYPQMKDKENYLVSEYLFDKIYESLSYGYVNFSKKMFDCLKHYESIKAKEKPSFETQINSAKQQANQNKNNAISKDDKNRDL